MVKVLGVILALCCASPSAAFAWADTIPDDRRYNHAAFLTAHNAFAASNAGWAYPQQTLTITEQLNYGVRGLMLDLHKSRRGEWSGGCRQVATEIKEAGEECKEEAEEVCRNITRGVTKCSQDCGILQIPQAIDFCKKSFCKTVQQVIRRSCKEVTKEVCTPIEVVKKVQETVCDGERAFAPSGPVRPRLCHEATGSDPAKGTDCPLTFIVERPGQEPDTLAAGLTEIRRFLERNPRAVVTVFFESYIGDSSLINKEFLEAGVSKYVFDVKTYFATAPAADWPTLGWMRRANKRLVVFSSNGSDGLTYDWYYRTETEYDLGKYPGCALRGEATRFGKRTARPVFVLNHFYPVSLPSNFEVTGLTPDGIKLPKLDGSQYHAINAVGNIRTRVQQCLNDRRGLPNFIGLDFVNAGGGSEVIRWLNAKSAAEWTANADRDLRAENIFGVEANGELKLYQLTHGHRWPRQNETIGTGWVQKFGDKIFAGGFGEFYGVTAAGDLEYNVYDRDKKTFTTVAQKVGDGFGSYKHVFAASTRDVYSIDAKGDLRLHIFDPEAKRVARASVITSNWGDMRLAFAGGNGRVYGVDTNGVLWVVRHSPAGARLTDRKRFGDGWQAATHAFSTGGGRIYATKADDHLYRFVHDTSYNWVEANSKIGGGWSGQFAGRIMGWVQAGPAQAHDFDANHTWRRDEGDFVDIGASPDGNVWAIRTDNQPYERMGQRWVKRDGAPPLKRIAVVGLHEVWAISAIGQIWTVRYGQWTQQPGSARDVAVGPNGQVWVLGQEGLLFKWTGLSWTRFPENEDPDTSRYGTALAIDATGAPWVVDEKNIVYRRESNTWVTKSGPKAKDIAAGPGGRVFIVGTDGRGYTWAGREGWILNAESGAQSAVAADASGPWVVNRLGDLYQAKQR